ncbi:MAG: GIY-YIG nuclease family protein [Ignavibacteriota bacterium]
MDWKEKHYYVYILASKKRGTLYTGVTNNLAQRVLEHRLKVKKGFAEKYDVSILVYYESFRYIHNAIQRETQLKKWNRDWKIQLIEKENKDWRDLLNDVADKEEIDSIIEMIEINRDNYKEER